MPKLNPPLWKLGGASLAELRALIVALGLACVALPVSAASGRGADRPHQPTFREFIEGLRPLAEARGVSRAIFDNAFSGVSFDPQVVAMTEAQPEFVRPIWDYVASAITPGRIERGRDRARSESRQPGRVVAD